MCDWHNARSESRAYGWSINDSDSATDDASDSSTPDILANVDVGRTHKDKLHIDIQLRMLRAHLRLAAQRLSVAQFAELRRRYDNTWLEVLSDL